MIAAGFRQQRWKSGWGSGAASGQALGQQGCPCRLASPAPSAAKMCARLWAESRQLGGILPRGCFCLPSAPSCLLRVLFRLSVGPGLWQVVRGSWVHVQGGAWASNKLCRAPSLPPSRLHLSLSSTGRRLHQLREALKILAERVLILETMIGLYSE